MDSLKAVLKTSHDHCAKQANQGFYNAVQEATAQQLRHKALGNIGTLAVVGAGVGAGSRGLLGLLQLAQRNSHKPEPTIPPPLAIDLPLSEQEEEKVGGVSDFLRGDYAQSINGIPWAIPAHVAAGAGGLAGGWTLMDYLLDKRRKGELQSELDKAKGDYETALSNGMKTAEEGSLASDLDRLYDEVEKRSSSLADMAGQATGMYGLYAGASGLAGALMAYQLGKKRQRKALIEKALKERRRKRFQSQPSALYLRPGTVSAPGSLGQAFGSGADIPSQHSEGLDL